MNKLKIVIFIIFICFSIDNFAKNYDFLADSSGKIIYLEFHQKNMTALLSNLAKTEMLEKLNLETIVISDFSKPSDKTFLSFINFLKQNSSNLKHLHFINSNVYEGDLEMEHLIAILKSIDSAPLQSFHWEYQDEIDDDDLMNFFIGDSCKILAKIKSLSFKGTEFDENSFFPAITKFDSLQTLDLSYSINSDEMFTSLVSHHYNYPRLNTLMLNGIDVSINGKINVVNPFPKLRKLEIDLPDYDIDDYLELINYIPGFFQNLDTLKVKTEYERLDYCDNSGFMLKKDNSINPNNLGQNREILKKLPQLKSISSFSKFNSPDTTNLFPYFKKIETNPAIFFTSLQDIEFFDSTYKDSKRKQVTLVGPFISKNEIIQILTNKKVFKNIKDIFLVGTNCTSKEIVNLRKIAMEMSIRIHQIDNFKSAQLNPAIYNNNMFQMMHMQQMMNQQMQKSINQSIPKFK